VRRLRRVVTGALEVERAAKRIGSSLQAHPLVWADAFYRDAAASLDIAELAITSAAGFAEGGPPDDAFTLADVPGVAVKVELAQGEKCDRCWQVLPMSATIRRTRRCAADASMRSSGTGRPPDDQHGAPSPARCAAPSPGGRGFRHAEPTIPLSRRRGAGRGAAARAPISADD
jgi:hypothetical protein